MNAPLIIGDQTDLHVIAVCERMRSSPLILDARSLKATSFAVDEGGIHVETADDSVTIRPDQFGQGWVRRVVPDSWLRSVVADSREAAEASGWTTLLAAVLQFRSVRWLSRIGAITRAENKLVQADVATALGVSTPRTVVTNSTAMLRQRFDGDVVVKPLGAGHFSENGEGRVVHAEALAANALRPDDLGVSPFLIQERLHARTHWRVVTVQRRVWVAALDAARFALDWRRDALAHHSFAELAAPLGLLDAAQAVAQGLDLGYSSQDWIETDDGLYLLDVNPSGQWMFLPETIAGQVALAIAQWLDGEVADA